MNRVIRVLLIIAFSPSAAYSIPRVELRTSIALDDSIQIQDAAFGESKDHLLVVDDGSDHVRHFVIEDDDLIENDPVGLVSEPRSVMWHDDLGTIVTGDKDFNGRPMVLFRQSEALNMSMEGTNIPFRLLALNNGFCGLFIVLSEEGFRYQVRSYFLQENDSGLAWNEYMLVDSILNTNNAALMKLELPSIAANETTEGIEILIAWHSPFVYGPVQEFTIANNDDPNIEDKIIAEQTGYITDPFLSWTDVAARETDIAVLEQHVVRDNSSYWNEDSLPDSFQYRPIISEIGFHEDELWVIRGTGDSPVFDVYDLAESNKPLYDEQIALDGRASFPSLSEIWKYRISDFGIIAFSNNQIYVFEIKD